MSLNFFKNQLNLRFKQFFIGIWMSFFMLLSANLWAEDRILESINVTEEQGYSIIDIKLNQQLTVTSYNPLESGDKLYIKVKRTGSALQITEEPTDYETLPWKSTRKVPLYQVSVDLSDQSLILEFKQSVKYKVRGGTNAFHIFVEVFHSGVKLQKQDKPVVALPAEVEIKQHTVQGALDPKMAQAMQDARTAMLEKNYSRAVQLYTKVVLDGSRSIYAQEALEYLGLARERKNQLAHAKVAYKKYLKLYPEGEDADRVKQRLTGILTARAEPRDKLRKGKERAESESDLDWTTYGSISQFYDRRESKRNSDSSSLDSSQLQNNLDITSRLRSQDYQITGRFSGAYDDNLETSDNDEHRISSFYLDFSHKPLDSALRIGRQSRSTGGVLGRFDGVLLSIPAIESVQLNLVAGYSVESSRDVFVNNDTYFYGISADLGTYFNAWDFNTFFIEQIHEGILDRRAVGGEIRYFRPNRSFFTFLDYDIHHGELNTFLFTGQYVFPDRTTINATFDQRKTPLLTSRVALNGLQGVELDDLLNFFSEDEIRQLARDRTATSRTLSLGISRPLTEKFQINADFNWSRTGASSASTGLPTTLVTNGVILASDASGDMYSYSTDLTANSLLTDGDLYTIRVRYSDSKNNNTTTFSLNTRYPITRELRINPRFRFDLRDNENGTTRWSYSPSVRFTYRILRKLQFELEGGGDWQKEEQTSAQRAQGSGEFERTKGYFVRAGYRLDF